MTHPEPNLLEFIDFARGHNVLHLGHRDADCDALGSAYAMSQFIPGDVGFVNALKTSARDLALGLHFWPIINPNPAGYDLVIIYDTPNLNLLGRDLPRQYALFDHHVPRGAIFSNLTSELADGAQWAWVRPVEATCAMLADLFLENDLSINRDAAIALAAGIITDTSWLRTATAETFERLAYLLSTNDLVYEDVIAVIDGAARRSQHRQAVLSALRRAEDITVGNWSIMVTTTDSHDNGFAVMSTLSRLPADVRVVAFPKNGHAMALVECDATLVNQTGIDMRHVAAGIAAAYQNGSQEPDPRIETWGSRIWGRVIAPAHTRDLAQRAVAHVRQSLTGHPAAPESNQASLTL